MHNITIRSVVNGVCVDVGCHTFVFNNIDNACHEVAKYLKDPVGAAKRWKEITDAWLKNQELPATAPEAPDPSGFHASEEACDPERPRPDLDRIARGPLGARINAIGDAATTKGRVPIAEAVEDAPSAEGTVFGS